MILALLALSALVQAPPPLQVEGKSLPAVPGPLTQHYPDPSRGTVPKGDMQAMLRRQARTSMSIPAVALPGGACVVVDTIPAIAGWKAYRADVPARGTLKVRLRGDHEAWFTVRVVNRWGRLEEGMLQNIIPTGNPEASYRNPKPESNQVYFVVDTTEISAAGEGYRLEITEK